MTHPDTPPPTKGSQIAVAIVLLAAGRSRRTLAGGGHKLLALFDDVPLVRRSACIATRSQASSTIVVTGDRKVEIEMALEELDIGLAHNPDYSFGMAGSLITGISAAQARQFDGVLVMLADMPAITSHHLDVLISCFQQEGGKVIVRATSDGRPGNPVVLPACLFESIRLLRGDVGARKIIQVSGLRVIDIELGDAACLDVDTPEAVAAAGGMFNG